MTDLTTSVPSVVSPSRRSSLERVKVYARYSIATQLKNARGHRVHLLMRSWCNSGRELWWFFAVCASFLFELEWQVLSGSRLRERADEAFECGVTLPASSFGICSLILPMFIVRRRSCVKCAPRRTRLVRLRSATPHCVIASLRVLVYSDLSSATCELSDEMSSSMSDHLEYMTPVGVHGVRRMPRNEIGTDARALFIKRD